MTYQAFRPSLLTLSPRLTLTGAPAASVQGINTTMLADGAWCYCQENKGAYQLDRQDDVTPPDGTTVIQPLAGPGRWKLFAPGGSGGLSNSYLLASDTVNPDTFVGQSGYILAGANVTRSGSGIFLVTCQFGITPDSVQSDMSWRALLYPGSTVADGTVDGAWNISIGSEVTVSPPSGATSTCGVFLYDSGDDGQVVIVGATLVGMNSTPAPAGASAIVVEGGGTGGPLTPESMIISAVEL